MRHNQQQDDVDTWRRIANRVYDSDNYLEIILQDTGVAENLTE
jgi:hypothetical protein